MIPAYLEETIAKTKKMLEQTESSTPFTLYHAITPIFQDLENHISNVKNVLEDISHAATPLGSIEEGKQLLEQLENTEHEIRLLRNSLTAFSEINSCSILPTVQDATFWDKYVCSDITLLQSDLLCAERCCAQLIQSCLLQKEYLCFLESTNCTVYRNERVFAGQYVYLTEGNLSKARSLLMEMAETFYTMLSKESPELSKNPEIAKVSAHIISALDILTPSNTAKEDSTRPASVIPDREEEPMDHNTDTALNKEDSEIPKPEEKEEDTPVIENAPSTTEEILIVPNPLEEPIHQDEIKTTISTKEYNEYKAEYETLYNQYQDSLQRLTRIQKEIGDMTNASQEQVKKFTQTKTAVQELQKKLKDAAEQLDKLNADIRSGKLTWEKKTIQRQPPMQKTSNNYAT